tara:strand:- start:1918 stop:2355 length:438 start_codon:yes stop_codon:yes gene_type:complete
MAINKSQAVVAATNVKNILNNSSRRVAPLYSWMDCSTVVTAAEAVVAACFKKADWEAGNLVTLNDQAKRSKSHPIETFMTEVSIRFFRFKEAERKLQEMLGGESTQHYCDMQGAKMLRLKSEYEEAVLQETEMKLEVGRELFYLP